MAESWDPSPTVEQGEEMPWGCFSCVELTHLSPSLPFLPHRQRMCYWDDSSMCLSLVRLCVFFPRKVCGWLPMKGARGSDQHSMAPSLLSHCPSGAHVCVSKNSILCLLPWDGDYAFYCCWYQTSTFRIFSGLREVQKGPLILFVFYLLYPLDLCCPIQQPLAIGD